MEEKNHEKIYITSIYASPNAITRWNLWQQLTEICPATKWPWFIGGDFNRTLTANERRSNATRTGMIDREFSNWVEQMALIDIGCSGPFFTWKREGCESRIDQVLMNARAKENYLDAVVKTLPWFKSDHRPLLLQMRTLGPTFTHQRPFRFNTSWILHEDFDRFIKDTWACNSS
ncbi:uncharacterized protein LOC114755556 [Neltuma alba]|uniref:uncharacterized protein LOC114755556 n=1 Tax=Neltuma alba TaxID=207710 RepID=UPI0010A355F2|nr:uncharacterized protein LOC114755556 [Prosopis alba]